MALNRKPATAFAIAGSCTLFLSTTLVLAEPRTLSGQLEALAGEEGFPVKGLEHLGAAGSRLATGDVLARLKVLLEGYNYVIVESRAGKIEKVVISAPSQPGPKAGKPSGPQPVSQSADRPPPGPENVPVPPHSGAAALPVPPPSEP